ncbi:uncharacterized protein LOC111595105 [Drosophila hydei]|uniref:Uncharacterized protein LOC111595105 n=1 Tax=Drosophila hydei TaxID=7224 RepID=A0A6J1LC78_DROHY|nr:uncharacterized protein LOC111595105 [Drosophila hydei]
MCLRRCILDTSFLLARSFGFFCIEIVEGLVVLVFSPVIWLLVILCTTGSLAIFGLTKFLRTASSPSFIFLDDAANLTVREYTVHKGLGATNLTSSRITSSTASGSFFH